MVISLQLKTFLFSFLYGIFFGMMSIWHFSFIKNTPKFYQLLFTFVFILDIVLGYILIMYKLNLGMFHIYFLLFLLGGYMGAFPLHKYVKYFWKKFLKHSK